MNQKIEEELKKRSLKGGYVVNIIFLILLAAYTFNSVSHPPLPIYFSSAHLKFEISFVLLAVLALIFLFFYWRADEEKPSRRLLRMYAIFFSVATVIALVGLVFMHPSTAVSTDIGSNYSIDAFTHIAAIQNISVLYTMHEQTPYAVGFRGVVDQASVPNTQGMFSVKDAQGTKAYVTQIRPVSPSPLRSGAPVVVVGSIQDNTVISSSNPPSLFVVSCILESGVIYCR